MSRPVVAATSRIAWRLKMFLALGPGSKADEVLQRQQFVSAPQGIADIGLVEESETTGEVDALCGTTEVVDRLHQFRTDGNRLAERPPRLEVIGVEVREPADLSPSQTLREPVHKRRKRRHRPPQPRRPSCIATHYRQITLRCTAQYAKELTNNRKTKSSTSTHRRMSMP